MEQRTGEILNLLLPKQKFVTTGEIAGLLGVSAKTVSRQLPKVEEELTKFGLSLEKKSGAGVMVVGSPVKCRALSEKIKLFKKRDYTPAERQSVIIGRLLQTGEPIKLFALSAGLNVTESTISNDLDKLDSLFKNNGLKLLRKPGLGVGVLGTEQNLRRAIVGYIYEHIGEEKLLRLVGENLDDAADFSPGTNFFKTLLNPEIWKKLEKIIRELESDSGCKFSDNAFIGMVVHLSLAVNRIKNGENFELNPETSEKFRTSKEFDAAKKIAEKISVAFEIEVPENEIFYIAMHISGARGRYNENNLAGISMTDNFRLVRTAKRIMKNAAKITGRGIDKDQNLLAGLLNHLAPSINRIKMNMGIRNPLLNEIKTHYPELFDLAKKCVVEFEEELGEELPDAETAYIAMHLGAALSDSEKFLNSEHRVIVACPTGMGTSKLLSSRLKKKFPSLKIVDELPILQITPELEAAGNFEFIISTVPIPRAKCPVLTVSATLTDADCEEIEKELVRQNKSFLSGAEEIERKLPFPDALQKMNLYGSAIVELIGNYFFVRREVKNIKEACDLVGEIVGRDREVAEKLSESLLKREEKGGTVISGRNLVLLHCKSEVLKFAAFGILQFGEGFDYLTDNNKIRTAIVLLAPENAEDYLIETIGHIAAVLPDRWRFIEILHEGDGEEIRNETIKIFENFYKTKYRELI